MRAGLAEDSIESRAEILIELRQVHRTHPMGDGVVNALNGVSLSVHAGAGLAITGPSGCGKSSLLNVLGLLHQPSAGTYRFAGHDMQALGPRALARLRGRDIGFVFQQFHLLPHLSAIDNVALPLRYGSLGTAEVARQAGDALDAVGLSERAAHKPAQLSGGQCQRVAIARALVGRPRLLLADEPTGALDSDNGARVLDLMLALHRQRGMTLIVVTHDAAIAQRLPRCVSLCDGRLHSDQTREAVRG
jgi:putative ABC transport system ATP-binding protein